MNRAVLNGERLAEEVETDDLRRPGLVVHSARLIVDLHEVVGAWQHTALPIGVREPRLVAGGVGPEQGIDNGDVIGL